MTSIEDMRYGQVPPPVWMLPKDLQQRALDGSRAYYEKDPNHESVQPPLYYMAAGLWCRIGAALHIPERLLPFWVRFLDAPILALLVWVSFCLTKMFFPDSIFMRLGVPMLIACMPQDLFYSISNGTLGALLYAVALYSLGLLYLREKPGWRLYAAAGLAVGATLVTSYTNVSVLLAPAALVVVQLMRVRKAGALRAVSPRLLVLCAAVGLLPALWAARNYFVFGALSAQEAYLRFAHWTPLPLADMLEHPIFTPEGALYFWTKLMAHYYRGEFTWHGAPMTYAWLDALFVWSSLVFLLIAVGRFLKRGRTGRAAGLMSAFLFAASVCALIGASIRYDFGDWLCPSSANPYFVAGRLIFGTVVPFALLYVMGLEVFLKRLRLDRFKWVVLVAMCVVMVESDLMLTFPAIVAKCNFYHLLRLQ